MALSAVFAYSFALVLVFGVYGFLYLWSVALAQIVSSPVAWRLNERVVRVIKGSILGEDHDYEIRRAVVTPAGIRVKELLIETETLGPVTKEDRRRAAETIYQSLSQTGGIERMAADPIGVWDRLNAALYHNAYFADQRVIEATVAHLLQSWKNA